MGLMGVVVLKGNKWLPKKSTHSGAKKQTIIKGTGHAHCTANGIRYAH